MKFGGLIKQLFSKSPKAAAAPTEVSPPPPPLPAPKTAQPRFPAKTTPGYSRPGNKPSMPGVEIPLQAILAILPLELKSKVVLENVAGMIFSVSVTTVLPQLASGSIKVTYGDIRHAAPDVFTADDSADDMSVSLPLHEILSRLNPALLTRRPTQKQLVVPDEIASPFIGRGDGLTLAVGNNSPQAPGAPVAPQVAAPAPANPVQRASSHLTAPLPGGTDMFQRKIAAQNSGNGKAPIFPRKPGAPSSNGTEFIQRKPAPPAAEISPSAPIAFNPSTPLPSAPVLPMAPTQHAPVAPTGNLQMLRPQSAPVVSNAPVHSAAPLPSAPPRPKDLLSPPPVARSVQPAKSAVAAPAPETQVLLVPLTALAESWPEAVRQEIMQFKLVDSRLAIPADIVGEALKRGRVVFTWKIIRSWVRPGPAPATSPNDARELELPLVVLAPLFVARRKSEVSQQPRVTVAETIPNLFFGLPTPEASPTPKQTDTNFYTWGETSDRARVDDTEFKRRPAAGSPGGTDLMLKCATPNEIVSRAAALDGVDGALIALPDGLMVASQIPPEFNGDTLAAFLPHIFSKVSQCTKELRMGDLNNLNFTVGNVPWKIFRVNAIYFAAFGRVGEGLPTAELASLAGELDRKRS